MAELTEELKKLKRPSATRHKLASVLVELEEPERVALETALTDATFSSEGLARALRASGHPIGVSSVKRFRRDVLGVAGA